MRIIADCRAVTLSKGSVQKLDTLMLKYQFLDKDSRKVCSDLYP